MRRRTIIFLSLFLVGAGIRIADVWKPIDGRVRESWRECDIASIARNYSREGMNLCYPRIDWRGDGPGYAEMEFPIYPWLIALLYKTVGFHEEIGRIISYLFSLLVMGVFFRLARYLLPDVGAITASLFFALSPLAVRISNTLQPEGLMFLCYVSAAYAFLRWLDNDSWRYYGMAVAATALAILAKANAAHIGLFFAILLLTRKGFRALKMPRVWIFAVASLLPGALWYTHAHNLWLTYGNSLGVSNEYHWIGWDFFTNPKFMLKIGYLDVWYVWMPTGVLIAALAIWRRKASREICISLFWLGAIAIYYVLASRTTGDGWATYYHVVSVPPVAILIGSGADVLGAWFIENSPPRRFRLSVLRAYSLCHATLVCCGMCCVLLIFLFQIWHLKKDVHPTGMQGLYDCAQTFAPEIPADALIVASGFYCRDEDGYQVAYNAPYFFYWMDRKGFNICIEEHSIERLNALIKRGARYFIAEKWILRNKSDVEIELREHFNVLQECPDALLFELTAS